jgi:hypothetical protein
MHDVSYSTLVNPVTPVLISFMYIKTVDDVTPARKNVRVSVCYVWVWNVRYMFCILLFNSVSYVFLSLCLCIRIVIYVLFCIFCFHRASWHSSATLTEVFPCFFLSCKGKCQGITRKDGARPPLFPASELCCSMYCLCRLCCFFVLFVCKCVLYYRHRQATQLQLNQRFSNFFFKWGPLLLARMFYGPPYSCSPLKGNLSFFKIINLFKVKDACCM